MATEMSATWRVTSDDCDVLARQPWDSMFEQNVSQLLTAWSTHYSLSLQQTLYVTPFLQCIFVTYCAGTPWQPLFCKTNPV